MRAPRASLISIFSFSSSHPGQFRALRSTREPGPLPAPPQLSNAPTHADTHLGPKIEFPPLPPPPPQCCLCVYGVGGGWGRSEVGPLGLVWDPPAHCSRPTPSRATRTYTPNQAKVSPRHPHSWRAPLDWKHVSVPLGEQALAGKAQWTERRPVHGRVPDAIGVKGT